MRAVKTDNQSEVSLFSEFQCLRARIGLTKFSTCLIGQKGEDFPDLPPFYTKFVPKDSGVKPTNI